MTNSIFGLIKPIYMPSGAQLTSLGWWGTTDNICFSFQRAQEGGPLAFVVLTFIPFGIIAPLCLLFGLDKHGWIALVDTTPAPSSLE